MVSFSRSLLCSFLLMGGCSAAESSDLHKAMGVIHYYLSAKYLTRSCYSVFFPEGKPSDFVGYLFSDFGAAERPVSSESSEIEIEQSRAALLPVFPASVEMKLNKLDPMGSRQIVLKSDDARGVVMVEAYEDPKAVPVFSEELSFKNYPAGSMVREMCEGNAQLGMSATPRSVNAPTKTNFASAQPTPAQPLAPKPADDVQITEENGVTAIRITGKSGDSKSKAS